MGKQNRKEQSVEPLNEYERMRMLRIQENNLRLQESGVKEISKSLRNLCGNHGKKKAKVNAKVTSIQEKDPEYNPDENEEVDDEDANVGHFQKVTRGNGRMHKLQFIPPGLMQNFASSSIRKRVLNNQHLSFKSMEKEHDGEDQCVNENFIKKRKGSMQFTLGEAVSQKKQEGKKSQDVQLPEKPTQLCSSRQERISGQKRKYIDRSGQPQATDQQDESEDLYNSDGDGSDNEQLLLGSGDGDDFLESEEESEEENENVELEIDDLGLEAIPETKKRGPTMMHRVHTRDFDKHKVLILNELGQPIGPVTKEEDTVGEFSRFLGTIARDYSYAPLTFQSWHKVPHKEKMWEYVLLKYIVPIEGKEWVLKTIGDAWRVWKCRFKKKHFYRSMNDKERWLHRSNRIPVDEFLKLLAMWKKKKEKGRCMRNREHRLSQKNMHTAGPKRFARIRDEMRNEHPNKELPSLADTFERTRKRKEGRIYKDSYDDTAKKLEAMKNYVPPEDVNGPTDPYLGVMSKEPNGHRRIYGRGVTNKRLKRIGHAESSSYVVPGEFVESLKATVVQELQKDMECEMARLDDTRKKLEEEHMKKKAELDDKQRELESEKENIFEEVMRRIVGHLPPDVVRQYLL